MFNLRLKDLRESKGMSQQQLANYLNVSQGSVGNWESGTREPNFEILNKIASYFNVTVDYLLNYQIEAKEITNARGIVKKLHHERDLSIPYIEEKLGVNYATFRAWYNGYGDYFNKSSEMLKLAELFSVSVDYLLGKKSATAAPKPSISVPVLGYVAAGIPIEAIEEIIDYEELDPVQFDQTFQYFALKIKGDSMMPRIQDGDVVIVRQQPDIETGDIAIVCINGDEATCKQIKKHSEGISLIPFNNSYEVKFYTNKEIEALPVTILGKVVELRGKF